MSTNLERVKLEQLKLPKSAQIFFQILSNIEKGIIEIELPSKERIVFRGEIDGECVNLKIINWKATDLFVLKGDIGLGESYIDGSWECDHIEKLIKLGIDNYGPFEKVIKGSILQILFYKIKHMFNRNTRNGSRKNIHAHYDLGNDFYKLWLDKTMTYSSALFRTPDMSLEEAQEAKYQYILDSLRVKEGDHILEIGCGWGGFMEYAASQGIRVTGITISKEQFDYAVKRNTQYADHATVLLQDYRDLTGKYDHIVSIEMFEALGHEYWNKYFKKVKSLLSYGGKALIQSITINNNDFKSYKKGTDFIQQYIFPGGMLPSPEVFNEIANNEGFNVYTTAKFGFDYGKTLNEWDESFMGQLDSVKSLGYDDSFIRTWHFYLKYCEGGFNAEKISVHQFLLEVNDD